MTWPSPDTFFVTYAYDADERMASISDNAATTLVTFAYDDLGRRINVTRLGQSAPSTTYSWDNADRTIALNHDFAGSTNDISWTFGYNQASQTVTRTASIGTYDWSAFPTTVTSKNYNGLNQDSAIVALTGGYDLRGNLTNDGARTFNYDLENRLLKVGVTSTGATTMTLTYDAYGRLSTTVAGTTSQFVYDDTDLIAEYDQTGTLKSRYVHGPDIDEPQSGIASTAASRRATGCMPIARVRCSLGPTTTAI